MVARVINAYVVEAAGGLERRTNLDGRISEISLAVNVKIKDTLR